MKLTKIHVSNFRSVEDSEEFEVDHTTCLVGKNEAGKTAVLQAIAGLHPHSATPMKYDKERDYPRRFLTQYESRNSGKEALVVKATWEISEEQADQIKSEFGAETLTGREVVLKRRYNEAGPVWILPIDFAVAVQHLIGGASFSASEKSQIKGAKDSASLRAAIQAIESKTEKHNKLLAQLDAYPDKTISGRIRGILSESLPRFMYFSTYDRMDGQVRLEHLKVWRDDESLFKDDNLRGARLFYEFLEYAGAPIDEIIASKTYESFTAKLQAASNAITDQILEYWSQNPYISVDVRVDAAKPEDKPPFNEGTVARARIRNELHRVDVPFSERSAGFIWFFSFLIKFARVRESGGPIILLLDERRL